MNPQRDHLNKFIECLGICHTVISEDKEIKGKTCKVYNASSPDELALVNGMRHFGFAFRERDVDDNLVVDMTRTGETVSYKLLHVIEFNSDRKRMSVLVRTQDNRVMIVCKGADSIINERLKSG
jgi:phospholipid-translocating ATPase